MVQQHKTCTKCGETKPLDGFHVNRGTADGRGSYCRECMSSYQRSYQKKNREAIRERERRYRKENPEKELEKKRRYYEENPEKFRERNLAYKKRNREIIKAKSNKDQMLYSRLSRQLSTIPLGTHYLPGEDALILADNGMTMYQKAIELGRTFNSVRYRRRALLAKGGVSNDRANA